MNNSCRFLVCVFAALLLGAAAKPKAKTPYSLVIGDLVRQQNAPGNPCTPDEDLCMDVMLETRLANVEVLAGNPTSQNLRVRHRAHVPYRRGVRISLAMIVGPAADNGTRQGINLGEPTDGQVCVDPSWFDPKEEGMRLPHGHRVNKDGDVCFEV